jgi:hypothetical protein
MPLKSMFLDKMKLRAPFPFKENGDWIKDHPQGGILSFTPIDPTRRMDMSKTRTPERNMFLKGS